MKIAYCIPLIEGSGGMERILSLKANYLAEHLGYEIFIITTEKEGAAPFFRYSPQIKIINLGIHYEDLWKKAFPVRIFNYFIKQKRYKKALSKCLNEIKPDITISMLRREINFISSIKDGSVKIGEFHFNKDNFRDYKKGIPLECLRKFITFMGMGQLVGKLKKLDQFVVLSCEDHDKWTELNNVRVIGNPVPFFPEMTAPLTKRKVIAVGRYTYQKGFDLLIDAWKVVHEKHPDWKLYIYGEGERKNLEKQIHSLRLGTSCLLKEPVKNIEKKYLKSSIFTLSSRFEGFGMVITEAMACGVPPVSFACPCGPKDIIRDGEDGLLVDPGNIQELAQKICYLIENEDLRRQMGHRAKINAKRFKIDLIMNQWKELFESLIKQQVKHH